MADILLTLDVEDRGLDSAIRKTRNFENQVDSLSKTTQQNTVKNTGNTKSMNALGVGMQQTGYQVGDFLVQVQSGTNAMVAFGQQATQLVGILPMFGSVAGISGNALVALSAGLGIAIPLLTAIGAAFLRTSDSGKTFEDTIEELTEAVDTFSDAMLAVESASSAARKEFGYTSGILEVLIRDMETLSRIEAFAGLDTATRKLREDFIQGFESDIENIADLLGKTGWFDELSDEVAQFDADLGTLESNIYSLDERLSSALNLRDTLLENAGGIEEMSDEQKGFYNALVETITQMERISAAQSGLEGNQQALLDGAEAFRDMWISVKTAIQEAVGAMPSSAEGMTDGQYQQMLYYQAYADSRSAAPGEPPKPKGSSGRSSRVREIEQATAALIDFDEATKNLVATQKLQQGIADNISTSFTDAYTSMIDGTKSVEDAFRDMARKIVQHLWEVFVVEQMVNSIGGGVMNLFGNAPTTSPRPIARNFSGGGYTGSGSRSGGLDGEGGFMAMLHPRETVVDHTKGQSMGDTIVVHQNFNLSANGDESIKRIISQEAPKIAQFTKASLLDDRRRGGKTKSTFG